MERIKELESVIVEVMELEVAEHVGDDTLGLIFAGFYQDRDNEIEIIINESNHVLVNGERRSDIYLPVATA